MKKIWILIPILIVSCTKETKLDSTAVVQEDSMLSVEFSDSMQQITKFPDSVVDQSQDVQRVLETGVMREETESQIIRYAEGKMLPFTIGDEIENNSQQLILKLARIPKGDLKVQVNPKDSLMNIRLNQVRYPSGTLDGPFGRSANLEISEPGEVWLIFGKSNMASSSPRGKFTITVE